MPISVRVPFTQFSSQQTKFLDKVEYMSYQSKRKPTSPLSQNKMDCVSTKNSKIKKVSDLNL